MKETRRKTDDPGASAPADADTPLPVREPGTEDVRAFLAANPHYLTDHPEVLAAVTPKTRHADGNITDLQGFLIERLRSENRKLAERHAELLATTRANAQAQSQVHTAALALLEARSFAGLIEVVTTDLALALDVDVVSLVVENPGELSRHSVAGIRIVAPGTVDHHMGAGRDVVLNAGNEGGREIYGAGAGLVASEALLRLRASPETPVGMLALASRNPAHFDPTQGRELLGFLAGVLELCIRTWLNLPRR